MCQTFAQRSLPRVRTTRVTTSHSGTNLPKRTLFSTLSSRTFSLSAALRHSKSYWYPIIEVYTALVNLCLAKASKRSEDVSSALLGWFRGIRYRLDRPLTRHLYTSTLSDTAGCSLSPFGNRCQTNTYHAQLFGGRSCHKFKRMTLRHLELIPLTRIPSVNASFTLTRLYPIGSRPGMRWSPGRELAGQANCRMLLWSNRILWSAQALHFLDAFVRVRLRRLSVVD